jgi:hypothetical protein
MPTTPSDFISAWSIHGDLLNSLQETRAAVTACFRVIAATGASELLLAEFRAAGITDGFGVRASAVLHRATEV